MSRCLLVYFSQAGSTGRLAESVAKGLRAAGHSVDLHNLIDGPAPAAGGYDLLGLGSPAYNFRPPFIVADHVNSLPSLSGKPFFVFVVFGGDPGRTGNALRRGLAEKGGRELGYSRYHGADYFLGYLKRGYLLSPGRPREDGLARAEAFGREMAERLAGKEHREDRHEGATHPVFGLERFLTNRFLVRTMYSRLFRVDRAKCTSCGVCMKLCPLQNVAADGDGRPVWGRNCMLCFYCEMKCPVDAIDSPVTWFLFRPFMIYNIWRASREPGLEIARVKQGQGKTRVTG